MTRHDPVLPLLKSLAAQCQEVRPSALPVFVRRTQYVCALVVLIDVRYSWSGRTLHTVYCALLTAISIQEDRVQALLSQPVETSPLSDLQPEDQPSAELEPSGWSQTRAARRKQKAKKRNKQLLVQDAKQELSDFDDLSDLAATDDEQVSEQQHITPATKAQHTNQQPSHQQPVANAANADVITVMRAGSSRTAGKVRTRASRFGSKKKPWLQTPADLPESEHSRRHAPTSPRIKAAQPDPEFLALVSMLAVI